MFEIHRYGKLFIVFTAAFIYSVTRQSFTNPVCCIVLLPSEASAFWLVEISFFSDSKNWLFTHYLIVFSSVA